MNSVAFYLDNSALAEVNFEYPLEGNPGCGATEFMTVLVASELSKRGVPVTLLTTSKGKFPAKLDTVLVEDINDAFDFCSRNNLILTIRAYISDFSQILEEISQYDDLKIVVWAHLTPNQYSLKTIAETQQVKAVVCLENNQRIRMGDSLARSKLITIPYGITGNTDLVPVATNSNNVVYIGALVPQKGFHLLADAWPRVLQKIPDAKLFVFGSGRLYDQRIILGPKGIAELTYENRIFRKLEQNNNSIEFLGNADSTTRNLILDSCKLGIVNPSAETETFCLSAVEFQQRGIPVIGGRKYGLLNTIKHNKTGSLVFNSANLHKHIIKILQSEKSIATLGRQAQDHVNHAYDLERVIDRWTNVFESLSDGSKIKIWTETTRMKVRSLQAVIVLLNRYLVCITKGYSPTLVTIWDTAKQKRRLLRSYLNRFLKKR
jgi:glycosyltransferase involved in cell wall biosynthesis